VYPLEENFRRKMGLPEGSGLGAIDITVGIEGGNWTEKEFGGAPLGDERLSQRLVEIATDKAGQPGRAYCGVAEGDRPKVKAYYRFIDKPDDSAVTMSAILQPHRVLKSGCGVEALAHKTAERLKRAIAINLVIAWRIMLMTLLGIR